MTPRFFKSFILVNIFIIPTNLFEPFIRFFRKTSVITAATLGRRIVDLGGNLITSLRSHKTRCPPCLGSKGPRDVTPHQPLGRLAGSVWENKTVDGPKLKVEHVKTVANFC